VTDIPALGPARSAANGGTPPLRLLLSAPSLGLMH
jgi:hypothetical protein